MAKKERKSINLRGGSSVAAPSKKRKIAAKKSRRRPRAGKSTFEKRSSARSTR